MILLGAGLASGRDNMHSHRLSQIKMQAELLTEQTPVRGAHGGAFWARDRSRFV